MVSGMGIREFLILNTRYQIPDTRYQTMNQTNSTSDKALHYLFTSRVRLKILDIFVPHPNEMFYVRQVTRMTGEEVNAVRRELERLKAIGLLETEERGNRLYYKTRIDFPFYYELLRMVGKTVGLGKDLIEKQTSLGRIKYAMLSGSFVKGRVPNPNDIDVLIVGHVELSKLQELIRQYEAKLGHEINYTVMTEEEFNFRKNRSDAFIRSVLIQPQIVVIGNEEELNA